MLSQLLRPLAYLTIRHTSRAPLYINWVTPALISGALVLVAHFMKGDIAVFGDSGAVSRTLSFLQSLPGFYIAALAAVATFANPDMQKLMPGTPPTISILYNGKAAVVQLTRRRFLSSMFAYLTALSIILTVVAIGAVSLATPLREMVDIWWHPWLKGAFSFFFFGFGIQLLVVTMWGIYYLGERVHTPDP